MTDIDIRREKLIKHFKYGGLGLVLVAVVPLLFIVASMVAATVTAGAIAVIGGIALVNLIPVISMKGANWRLKAMKAEARTNPIETAQNQLAKMANQLDAFKQETAQRRSDGKAMVDEISELRKEDPEGAARFDDRIAAYHQEMQDRDSKIEDMVRTLDDATTRVNNAARLWKLEQKYAHLKSPSESAAMLDKILMDEAIDEALSVANNTASRMHVDAVASRVRQEIKEEKKAKTVKPALTNDSDSFVLPKLTQTEKVQK